MITEKEHKVSNENYEISKKIYYLFKKYKEYDKKLQEEPYTNKYNPDDLFKNRKKNSTDYSQVNEVALVEVKKENWIIRLIKRLFRIKG